MLLTPARPNAHATVLWFYGSGGARADQVGHLSVGAREGLSCKHAPISPCPTTHLLHVQRLLLLLLAAGAVATARLLVVLHGRGWAGGGAREGLRLRLVWEGGRGVWCAWGTRDICMLYLKTCKLWLPCS